MLERGTLGIFDILMESKLFFVSKHCRKKLEEEIVDLEERKDEIRSTRGKVANKKKKD
jgi:hypothetical protein